MKHTDEQVAIVAEARDGKGDMLITALAGCGKTFTLLECVKVMPQRSILFAAFNKGIAAEAEKRAPKLPKGSILVVQTLHALARQILFKHYPKLSIDKTATEGLVNVACEMGYPGAPYEVRRSAMRLLRAAKEALSWQVGANPGGGADVWSPNTLLTLGFDLSLFSPKLTPEQLERTLDIVRQAIILGLDIANRTIVDFCDLVWLVLALDLAPPSRYQAIVLDEVQDISAPQLALINKLCLPHTRIIAAGDEWQQIYAWRGSLGREVFRGRLGNAKAFPLTMTWRCSKAVVTEANELVPALRARPDADEGSVDSCTLGELPFKIGQGYSEDVHTFVLSRTNTALLDCALFLWRAGIKFQLNAGQMLLEPLFHVLDRELDTRSDAGFRSSLGSWYAREAVKADKIGATSRREQLDEQRHMLLAALRYAQPSRIKQLLRSMLVDNKSGVLLSTVHKVKGLEAEQVFLLKQTFARQAMLDRALTAVKDDPGFGDAAEMSAHLLACTPLPQEELNLEYVGITRAKLRLCWVDVQHRDQPELLEAGIATMPFSDLDAALAMNEQAIAKAEEAGRSAEANNYAQRCNEILGRMQRGR